MKWTFSQKTHFSRNSRGYGFLHRKIHFSLVYAWFSETVYITCIYAMSNIKTTFSSFFSLYSMIQSMIHDSVIYDSVDIDYDSWFSNLWFSGHRVWRSMIQSMIQRYIGCESKWQVDNRGQDYSCDFFYSKKFGRFKRSSRDIFQDFLIWSSKTLAPDHFRP